MNLHSSQSLRLGRSSQAASVLALSSVLAAIMISAGAVNASALGLLVLAIVAGVVARFVPTLPSTRGPLVVGIAVSALAGYFYTGIYGREETLPFVVMAAAALAALLWESHRLWAVFVTIAALGVLAMMIVPWHWGVGYSDVFYKVQDSSFLLLHGKDPYLESQRAAIPISCSQLVFGTTYFSYGPAVPILAMPFRLIGDVRVGDVVACAVIVLCGTVLARRTSGPFAGRRSLLLLIASPLAVAMVLNAWVDTLQIAALGMWLVLEKRHHKLGIVALAISLVVKSTAPLLLLPFALWSRRYFVQSLWALGIAGAATLVFAWWDGFSSFFSKTIGVYLSYTDRCDSLTVNSVLHLLGATPLPAIVGTFIPAVVAIALLGVRPRHLGDVCRTAAVMWLVLMLFAKWAYFNYYYVAGILLTFAVLTDGIPLDGGGPMDWLIGRLTRFPPLSWLTHTSPDVQGNVPALGVDGLDKLGSSSSL